MKLRQLAGRQVAEIALGCMTFSHGYSSPPSREHSRGVLLAALELGVTHFDTAALYGFGRNEDFVGEVLAPFRQRILLASKCGMTTAEGKRVIDSRPESLKRTCQESLRRLRTDVIDLYYLHRWDKKVPIEESVGALADMVRSGWIRSIGLSEVSAATLRKAHAVHPIAAVQNEYSLWTRNPEIALLEACRELVVALVAFSPLGRGFLTGAIPDPPAFEEKDLRGMMPRFHAPHYTRNLQLLDSFEELAREASCTKAQLALAWMLRKAPHVIPVIGTTSIAHLSEDVDASRVALPDDLVKRVEKLINQSTVSGARYSPQSQAEIDTEDFTF